MKKKFINLGFFIFSLCGLFTFSCRSSSPLTNGKNRNSSDLSPIEKEKIINKDKDSENNNSSSDNSNPGLQTAREKAFLEVVKALHAPYKSGDRFFKIFTDNKVINETKNGTDVAVIKDGDSNIAGQGKWSVRAGKDVMGGINQDTSIVYNYEKFQPKGSKITIDGKMTSMYRSHGVTDNTDAIGFNQYTIAEKNGDKFEMTSGNNNIRTEFVIGVNGVKDLKKVEQTARVYIVVLSDVLNIGGEFKAKLEFIYPGISVHSNIREEGYDIKIVNMFTKLGSSIEFTYDGETKKLTEEEIKKIITVA